MLLLPWPEAVEAARRKRRVPSVHCLRPEDRFSPVEVLGDCSFASFSPDGSMLACTTSRGIEVRPRRQGEGRVVSSEGFRLAAQPWHPGGAVLLASGPSDSLLAPGEAPFAVRVDGSGATRLLTDLPGGSRAASFSPDGQRVALTYTDGFVHRMLLADWEGGPDPRLVSPRVLLPFDVRSEPDTGRMMRGLAWYETRGFTPDGQWLVFASDRGGGMLNGNVYMLELSTGRVRHVTRDDGFVEGAALDAAGATLYYGSTRAREPSFLTLVTGPQVPPFLGFAAASVLHDRLASGLRAPVGNGDVLAADPRTGLRARLVARREVLAGAAGLAGDVRVSVCSGSPDGRELAVSVSGAASSAVVILRREAGPAPVTPAATPVPPTAAPIGSRGFTLLPEEPAPLSRTLEGRFAGRVRLDLRGGLGAGSFRAVFSGFSEDGVLGFDGPLGFEPAGAAVSHEADVLRLRGSDAGDEDARGRGFYRASLRLDGPAVSGGLAGRSPRGGTLEARARDGVLHPEGRWSAGRGRAEGVRGAERCPKRRRRRRRRGRRGRKR